MRTDCCCMSKKKARAPQVRAANAAGPKKPNPFEIKKTKTRFEVVGRRTAKSGAARNVVQAREDATKRVRESARAVKQRAAPHVPPGTAEEADTAGRVQTAEEGE